MVRCHIRSNEIPTLTWLKWEGPILLDLGTHIATTDKQKQHCGTMLVEQNMPTHF